MWVRVRVQTKEIGIIIESFKNKNRWKKANRMLSISGTHGNDKTFLFFFFIAALHLNRSQSNASSQWVAWVNAVVTNWDECCCCLLFFLSPFHALAQNKNTPKNVLRALANARRHSLRAVNVTFLLKTFTSSSFLFIFVMLTYVLADR